MLQRESLKYLIHRDFFEKGDAKNLQDFSETTVDFQFLLEDGHEYVNADGDPDLGFDGVLGGSTKGLDPQVLFDPFEEQLHTPAALVKVGNGQGRKGKVVGQEDQALPGIGIDVTDAAKRIGIGLGGFRPLKKDCVIAA